MSKWKCMTVCVLVVGLVTGAVSAQKKEGRTVTVSIKNSRFTPARVSVKKGDTVVWTNNDDRDHTVVADDGSFSSGTIKPDKSYQYTFRKAGTFGYACKLHPRMKGSV